MARSTGTSYRQLPPAYFDSVGVYDPKQVFYMNGGLTESTQVTQANKLSNGTFALNVDDQEWFRLTHVNGSASRCDATMAMAHFDRVTPEGFEIWIVGGADKDARFDSPPSADIYRVVLPTVLGAPAV